MIINQIFYYSILCVSWMPVVTATSDGNQETETRQETGTKQETEIPQGITYMDPWRKKEIKNTDYLSPEFEKEISQIGDLDSKFSNLDTMKLDNYFEIKVKRLSELLSKHLVSDNVNGDPAIELSSFYMFFYQIRSSNLQILNDIRKSFQPTDSDIWRLLDNYPRGLLRGQDFPANHNVLFTILIVINNNVAKSIGSQHTSNFSERLQKYQKMLENLHNSLVPVLKARMRQDPVTLESVNRKIGSIKKNRVDIYEDMKFRHVFSEVVWGTVWLVSIYGCPEKTPSDALAMLLNKDPNVLSCLDPVVYKKGEERSIMEPVLHLITRYLLEIKTEGVKSELDTISEWARKLHAMEGPGKSVNPDIWELERQIYCNGDWAQAFSKVDADTLDTYFEGRVDSLSGKFELNKDSSGILELSEVSTEAGGILKDLRNVVYMLRYSNLGIVDDIRKSLKTTTNDHLKNDQIDHLLGNYRTLLPQDYIHSHSLVHMENDVLGWCIIMVTVQYAINDKTAKLIDSQDTPNPPKRLQRYQNMLDKLNGSIAPLLKVRNIGKGYNYDDKKTSLELIWIIFEYRDTVENRYIDVSQNIDQILTPNNNIYEDEDFQSVVGSIIFETLLLVSIYPRQEQKSTAAMTQLLDLVPHLLYYLESGQPKIKDRAVLQPVLHHLGGYLQNIDARGVERRWFTQISKWAKTLRDMEGPAEGVDRDVWEFQQGIYNDKVDWESAFSKIEPAKLNAYFEDQVNSISKNLKSANICSNLFDVLENLRDLVFPLRYLSLGILYRIKGSLETTNEDDLDIDYLLENYDVFLPVVYRTYIEDVYSLEVSNIMVTVQILIINNTIKLIGSQDPSNSSELQKSSEALQEYQKMLVRLRESIVPLLKQKNTDPTVLYNPVAARIEPEYPATEIEVEQQYIRCTREKSQDTIKLVIDNSRKEIERRKHSVYDNPKFRFAVRMVTIEALGLVSTYGCQGHEPPEALAQLFKWVPRLLYFLEWTEHKGPEVVKQELDGLDGYLREITTGGDELELYKRLSAIVMELRAMVPPKVKFPKAKFSTPRR